MRWKLSQIALLVLIVKAVSVASWSDQFNFYDCYERRLEERMPNTIDNLIGLVEKYESEQGRTNKEEVAEMILHRYRKDGMIFDDTKEPLSWHVGDDMETHKQELIFKLLSPSKNFPVDSFEPREECGLHHLVSHSNDNYPHKGVSDVWDGTINRQNKNDRKKRSPQWSSSASNSEPEPVPSYSSGSYSKSGRVKRDINNFDPIARSRYNLPPDVEPGQHTVENGIMETPYGPVAAGTLLAGIMAMEGTNEYSIESIYGDDVDYMPNQMQAKTLNRAYASSLAGDIAQVGLISYTSKIRPEVGPKGRYNNCTTCAQLFSLVNNEYSYLSRAEVFAGVDVLILYAAYHDGDSSTNIDSLGLSELLRLYYSEKGLPGLPEVKACNRLSLFSRLDKDKLSEQALHFAYAYQHYTSLKGMVQVQKDNFDAIESNFKTIIADAMSNLESFISSYNYDDEGYAGCLYGGSTFKAGPILGNNQAPPSEGMTDLIAIYAQEGDDQRMKEQRQLIGDVARRIGVATTRSRVGVINGKSGDWMQRMENVTNIGDWACNFTNEETPITSGKADILAVLETLSGHYHSKYALAMNDMELSSGRSQVVLWQIPSSFQSDTEILNRTLSHFRNSYPDVRIFFVGKNKNSYINFLEYEDDYLSITGLNYDEILAHSISEVKMSPRYFIYPACDPHNNTEASRYREEAHLYEGYVYPNYTTYITIPAKNFIFSEKLKIKISGDVRACFSRTNRLALENYSVKTVNIYRDSTDDVLTCVGGKNDEEEEEYEVKYLCNRYVYECNPIHISITGLDANSRLSCNNGGSGTDDCEFSNQIKYELTHDGMVCGSSSLGPLTLLVAAALLLQKLLQ